VEFATVTSGPEPPFVQDDCPARFAPAVRPVKFSKNVCAFAVMQTAKNTIKITINFFMVSFLLVGYWIS
jgi:hypothetical protein